MKFLKQRALKKWREKTLDQIDDRVQSEVAVHTQYIVQAQKAGEVARMIVANTDIPFEHCPYIEAIGGQVKIYNGSRELVHHLAKKLHLTFRKEFKKWAGSMTYTCELMGANIAINDIKNVPHCEIHKITKRETITTYEIECQ